MLELCHASPTQAHTALLVTKSWQNHFILADPAKFHEGTVVDAEKRLRLGIVSDDPLHLSRQSASLIMQRLQMKLEEQMHQVSKDTAHIEFLSQQVTHWKSTASATHIDRKSKQKQLKCANDQLAAVSQVQQELHKQLHLLKHDNTTLHTKLGCSQRQVTEELQRADQLTAHLTHTTLLLAKANTRGEEVEALLESRNSEI